MGKQLFKLKNGLISIYFADREYPTEGAHVHVRYKAGDERTAKFFVSETGVEVASNNGFSTHDVTMISELLSKRISFIMESYHDYIEDQKS